MNETLNGENLSPDHRVQIVLYLVVGIVSFISNTLLFLVLGFNKQLHTKTNFLLANLGLTDWLVVVFGTTINISNLSTEPIRDGTPCQVTGMLVLVPFLVSNFNLTLIAFHRYILIVRNSSYTRVFSSNKMVIYIVLVWLVGILMATPPLFGWGHYSYNINRTHCMINWATSKTYLFFIQIAAFPIPLAIMIFSYYKVFQHSYSSWKRLQSSSDRHHMSKTKKELTLTITLLLVLITFLILYLPYAIVIYMEGVFNTKPSQEFGFSALVLAYASSMCNFWIYAVMSTKFRKSTISLFKSCCNFRKRARVAPLNTTSAESQDDAIDEASSVSRINATPELSARRRSVMIGGGNFYKSVHSECENNTGKLICPNSMFELPKKNSATLVITSYK